MFVRKKKNRSGTTSVVVVDKSHGKFKELVTIGISKNEEEINQLVQQGEEWISTYYGTRDIFKEQERIEEENKLINYFISNVENVLLNGTQILLDHVFQLIGFDQIGDDILKHLVTARISQPSSKAATVEYLKSYFDEDVELHNIYRYLDKLHKTQQELVQQISVEHTRKILGEK